MNHFRNAFTLIELLIVVAIIAILAAIAVPNFLEAQVRAKVSRAKSDMRSLATAIEAYSVDYNMPPLGPRQYFNARGSFVNSLDVYVPLSTPVAYMTDPQIPDPFALKAGTQFPGQVQGDRWAVYRYSSVRPLDLQDDFSHFRAHERGYDWWLYSYGPSRDAVSDNGNFRFQAEGMFAGWLPLHLYDPTNGTMSKGMIVRTNKGEYTGAEYTPAN